ncbi:dimethyladenosine transferase [Saprolegnia diclina VS20]|uniref:rRNA adenine N(6)-methyltransferase n=1 Tax=Saprolegnia diclina (strain VS20) TaxID=1156394 RepID=T0S232_SAPDV|nr:dimethyladenosine transferase [Saprolegnia diclina VS20]EQC36867.1 dimethyladenosine transferase [Saprolegnia diclina VS20]|eukprot:XP_008609648.1 dimethyladenosine transferase [Saprolegnia diclina VS20]
MLRRAYSSAVSAVRVANTPSLKRSLGQHLLVNEGILQDIIDASHLRPTDHVLEVGPGTGNLTLLLLGVAERVTCVEYDHRMVAQLEARFPNEIASAKLTILRDDFAKFDLRSIDPIDMCVANIPYNISSPIVAKLLSQKVDPKLRASVLMVQDEFALRLMATAGHKNYSRLSVNTAFQANISTVVKVPRKHFVPPPKVDSRVIKIERKTDQPDASTLAKMDTLLRIAFQRKNKTLRSQLTSSFAADGFAPSEMDESDRKAAILSVLHATNLHDARAVKLTCDQFHSLLVALEAAGVAFKHSEFHAFGEMLDE